MRKTCNAQIFTIFIIVNFYSFKYIFKLALDTFEIFNPEFNLNPDMVQGKNYVYPLVSVDLILVYLFWDKFNLFLEINWKTALKLFIQFSSVHIFQRGRKVIINKHVKLQQSQPQDPWNEPLTPVLMVLLIQNIESLIHLSSINYCESKER